MSYCQGDCQRPRKIEMAEPEGPAISNSRRIGEYATDPAEGLDQLLLGFGLTLRRLPLSGLLLGGLLLGGLLLGLLLSLLLGSFLFLGHSYSSIKGSGWFYSLATVVVAGFKPPLRKPAVLPGQHSDCRYLNDQSFLIFQWIVLLTTVKHKHLSFTCRYLY